MEPLANYLPPNRRALTQSPESTPTEPKAITQTATRTLWVRMAEIYGHRWSTAYGTDPDPEGAAGTWAKGLAGVTGAQLAEGLKACIASSEPWPPTLPEFRAMCLAVPSLVSVRHELLASASTEPRSPFATLVAGKLDWWQFRQSSAKDAERILREAYDDVRETIMRGGQLPDVVPAIEHAEPDKPKKATPEEGAAHAGRIANLLRGIDEPIG